MVFTYSLLIVAPNVTDGPDNQAVLENENVLLSCVAEGRPPPTITWFKRSTDQIVTDVQQSEGVSIVTQSRGARQVVSNLTIESVQPRDAADYLCNATNVAGSDVQAASLSVHGKFLFSLHVKYIPQFCSFARNSLSATPNAHHQPIGHSHIRMQCYWHPSTCHSMVYEHKRSRCYWH